MLQQEVPREKERQKGLFGRLLRKVDGCAIKVVFDGKMEEDKVMVGNSVTRTTERIYLFLDDEPIRGRALLSPKGEYKHNGVLITLIGSITMDNGTPQQLEFVHQEKRFEPGTLHQATPLEFLFQSPREYESYNGVRARVAYHVAVTVQRPVKNVAHKEPIWVSTVDHALTSSQPDTSQQRSYFRETEFGPASTALNVGVGNRLHIEFRYDKHTYHLKERILGKVTFKIAGLHLRYGEVGVVRKELAGVSGEAEVMHSETLQKFEVMDGTPIEGEVVPIRLYLASIPWLTPTYSNVHKCFQVRYYINLVLITTDGKRFFKQQEVVLYRRAGQEVPVVVPQDED